MTKNVREHVWFYRFSHTRSISEWVSMDIEMQKKREKKWQAVSTGDFLDSS